MPVQGSRVKLGQEENPHDAGVDAVRDRDIDEAVFAAKRHGGLSAVFGQRKQACALTAAEDYGEHVVRPKWQEWLLRLHAKTPPNFRRIRTGLKWGKARNGIPLGRMP